MEQLIFISVLTVKTEKFFRKDKLLALSKDIRIKNNMVACLDDLMKLRDFNKYFSNDQYKFDEGELLELKQLIITKSLLSNGTSNVNTSTIPPKQSLLSNQDDKKGDDTSSKKLKLIEVSLLYAINEDSIGDSEKERNELASEFGHTSGKKLQQEYNKFLIKHNRITFDTKATRTNQIKRYDKIRHLIKPEKLAIFEQELQKMQDELDNY